MQKFFAWLLNAIMTSLALSAALCKPAMAEEASSWIDYFRVSGYASAGVTSQRDQAAKAAINEVSMILTWANDSRFSFFGELELERPLEWGKDDQFNLKARHLDIERLYVDYNLSEQINFRAGRFLTPNSRWNLLHAPPLVWTSSRPLATSYLFPTGTNGAMLFGALPLMNGAFEYKLFAELLEDQEQDGDELQFEHVLGARVSLKNQSDFGLSFLSFTEKGVDSASYKMLGLDFLTHFNTVEISGEAFQRFNTNNKDGGSGAFLQTAVPLGAFGLNDWYWITRLETLQLVNQGARQGAGQGFGQSTGQGVGESDAQRWLVGATWRIKPTQLLKFEFTGGSAAQAESPRGFAASFALFF